MKAKRDVLLIKLKKYEFLLAKCNYFFVKIYRILNSFLYLCARLEEKRLKNRTIHRVYNTYNIVLKY